MSSENFRGTPSDGSVDGVSHPSWDDSFRNNAGEREIEDSENEDDHEVESYDDENDDEGDGEDDGEDHSEDQGEFDGGSHEGLEHFIFGGQFHFLASDRLTGRNPDSASTQTVPSSLDFDEMESLQEAIRALTGFSELALHALASGTTLQQTRINMINVIAHRGRSRRSTPSRPSLSLATTMERIIGDLTPVNSQEQNQ